MHENHRHLGVSAPFKELDGSLKSDAQGMKMVHRHVRKLGSNWGQQATIAASDLVDLSRDNPEFAKAAFSTLFSAALACPPKRFNAVLSALVLVYHSRKDLKDSFQELIAAPDNQGLSRADKVKLTLATFQATEKSISDVFTFGITGALVNDLSRHGQTLLTLNSKPGQTAPATLFAAEYNYYRVSEELAAFGMKERFPDPKKQCVGYLLAQTLAVLTEPSSEDAGDTLRKEVVTALRRELRYSLGREDMNARLYALGEAAGLVARISPEPVSEIVDPFIRAAQTRRFKNGNTEQNHAQYCGYMIYRIGLSCPRIWSQIKEHCIDRMSTEEVPVRHNRLVSMCQGVHQYAVPDADAFAKLCIEAVLSPEAYFREQYADSLGRLFARAKSSEALKQDLPKRILSSQGFQRMQDQLLRPEILNDAMGDLNAMVEILAAASLQLSPEAAKQCAQDILLSVANPFLYEDSNITRNLHTIAQKRPDIFIDMLCDFCDQQQFSFTNRQFEIASGIVKSLLGAQKISDTQLQQLHESFDRYRDGFSVADRTVPLNRFCEILARRVQALNHRLAVNKEA